MFQLTFNPLNAELNPICHFLTLLGAHHILHVSRMTVKEETCPFYIWTQCVPRSKQSPFRLYKTYLLILYKEQALTEHSSAMLAPYRIFEC